MKTIEEFYNEIMASRELTEAANNAHTENRLAEFLAEHGVEGTAEAFEALVQEKKKTGIELSDNELEEAVGGVNWSKNGYESYESEVRYLYNVGDKVIVDCWFRNLTGTITCRKIEHDPYGFITGYYPMYYIKFDIDTSSDWYKQNYLAPYIATGTN